MDTELIKAVVAEVIRVLAEKNKKHGFAERVILVLTGGTLGIDEAVESLAKNCPRVSFSLVCTPGSQKVHRLEKIERLLNLERVVDVDNADPLKLIRGAKAVAVPALSRNTASKVASTYFDGLGPQIILEALMSGIPVVAARDAADPDNPMWRATGRGIPNPGLARALRENLRRVEAHGVKLVWSNEIGRVLKGLIEQTRQQVSDNSAYIPGNRRLISAREIMGASGGEAVEIPRGSIVTPLARELAVQKKVRIIFAGEN